MTKILRETSQQPDCKLLVRANVREISDECAYYILLFCQRRKGPESGNLETWDHQSRRCAWILYTAKLWVKADKEYTDHT